MTILMQRLAARLGQVVLAGALMTSAATVLAQAPTPVGSWQTIDDKTGQPRALVQITAASDGTLSGKVIDAFGHDRDPARRCTACTDSRKDQLIFGEHGIDDGHRHAMEGKVPGRIPGIFPGIGHGYNILVLQILPLAVPSFFPGFGWRWQSGVAVQPLLNIVMKVLLAPQQAGKRLPLNIF